MSFSDCKKFVKKANDVGEKKIISVSTPRISMDFLSFHIFVRRLLSLAKLREFSSKRPIESVEYDKVKE